MIFVATGTNGKPFDRLLRAAAKLEVDEELIVQHGPSRVRPAGAMCLASVGFDEFGELVRRARVMITHGGVGSVLVALANGRRPLVVPRLARYGEAVDDHQLDFARRLDAAGLVTLVTDPDALVPILAAASTDGDESRFVPDAIVRDRGGNLGDGDGLVRDLGGYLREVVEVRGGQQ